MGLGLEIGIEMAMVEFTRVFPQREFTGILDKQQCSPPPFGMFQPDFPLLQHSIYTIYSGPSSRMASNILGIGLLCSVALLGLVHLVAILQCSLITWRCPLGNADIGLSYSRR